MDEDLKPIRTFEGDIASSVRSNQGSVVHIALAEDAKRREQEKGKTAGNKNILFGTLGIFLFLCSLIFVGFGIYTTINKGTTPVIPIPVTKTSSLFKTDKELVLALAFDATQSEVVQKLGAITPETTLGTMTRVVITQAEATSSRVLSSEELVAKIFPKVPDLFKRSLSENFEYGVYQDTIQKPFFIFLSSDYDRTSAGLLSWERDMRYELAPIFREETKAIDENGNPVPSKLSQASFSDKVVKNVELRILRNEDGTEYLVYGFPKRNTLLIAPDTKTFFLTKDALN